MGHFYSFTKKLPEVKSRPRGKNSPKRRKFAQSGHPEEEEEEVGSRRSKVKFQLSFCPSSMTE
jgi:hypothetical protein